MLLRRAPERHDPVTHELVERALVLEHHVDHTLEVIVEHLDDDFWWCLFAHASEAADITIEDGALGARATRFEIDLP